MTEGDLLPVGVPGRPPRWPAGMAWTWSPPRWHGRAARPARWHTRAGDPARPCRPGPASRAAGPEASRQGGPGAVGHQVQQPAALQVDQTGDPSGRRRRGCPKNARLVQAEGRHPPRRAAPSPSGVPWSATARITVAQPTPRSRATAATAWEFLADPTTGLSAGSLGQHRPGTDRGRPLGPGVHPAGWRTTAPDPLAPGQHTGRPPTEQVAHPDRTAAVELGPYPRPLHPTAVAAVWTASRHSPPATTGGEDLEAVQAEQPGRRRTPVVAQLGPPVLPDVTHPQARRGLRCCSGRSSIAGSSKPPQAS